MNDFKNNGFKKGVPKFGGKKKNVTGNKHAGRHRHEERGGAPATELFSATCSECRNKCEVPFRPSSDKPVYCSACFGMKKSANESRGSERNNRSEYAKPSRDERPQRQEAPKVRNDADMADLKRQISGLEQKLNRILDLINPPMPSQKVPTVVAEKVAKKVVKKPVKVVAKKAPSKTVVKKVAVKKTAAKKVAAKKVAKKVTKKQAAPDAGPLYYSHNAIPNGN